MITPSNSTLVIVPASGTPAVHRQHPMPLALREELALRGGAVLEFTNYGLQFTVALTFGRSDVVLDRESGRDVVCSPWPRQLPN